MLDNHLLPFMPLHCTTQFLQDGAPCYASKKVKEFLKDKDMEDAGAGLPGNSSDLNPKENVWDFMKMDIEVVNWLGNSPDLNRKGNV